MVETVAMRQSVSRPDDCLPRPVTECDHDHGPSFKMSDASASTILCYNRLHGSPQVFKSLTGMTVAEFDTLAEVVMVRLEEADRSRLNREGRQRAPGGGHPYGLSPRDRILLTVLWLHQRPTHDVLGFLFGVSKTTVARTIARIRPLLITAPVEKRQKSPSTNGSEFGSGGSLSFRS